MKEVSLFFSYFVLVGLTIVISNGQEGCAFLNVEIIIFCFG